MFGLNLNTSAWYFSEMVSLHSLALLIRSPCCSDTLSDDIYANRSTTQIAREHCNHHNQA